MMSCTCSHLQPFVDTLVAEGASIERTETTWSNVRSNIVLSRGPSIAAARERWRLPVGVQLWFNDDGHYALENGLSCVPCAMSISWPRPERGAG